MPICAHLLTTFFFLRAPPPGWSGGAFPSRHPGSRLAPCHARLVRAWHPRLALPASPQWLPAAASSPVARPCRSVHAAGDGVRRALVPTTRHAMADLREAFRVALGARSRQMSTLMVEVGGGRGARGWVCVCGGGVCGGRGRRAVLRNRCICSPPHRPHARSRTPRFFVWLPRPSRHDPWLTR